ncbi:uncharacterized protein [Chelonus insularis]|uniref:uncharacterized protein n=1 Tax=Chelonus insularis TaxID=460826 RepID=UPI0015888D7C|nr:uncharacterized protein LOC118065042 [Chelonus insularis]
MTFIKFLFIITIMMVNLSEIFGHGMLMDPVNRGSAWRKGFNTPVNYNDNGNYCGGYTAHFITNKGKCGVCGDNYSNKQPRSNENGGRYGTGTIVKSYQEGQQFDVIVNLSVNHRGYFEFALCPLKGKNDIETEECFAKYPLKLASGKEAYNLTSGRSGYYKIKLQLPKGLTCEQCSLRWNYKTGNAWGTCGDGKGATGCGNQETFRTCSDISIVPK